MAPDRALRIENVCCRGLFACDLHRLALRGLFSPFSLSFCRVWPRPATTIRPACAIVLKLGRRINSQFAIEALPESPAKSWTKTARRTLRVGTSGATCPAQEETRYTVVAVKGDMVFLTKNYLLRSAPLRQG